MNKTMPTVDDLRAWLLFEWLDANPRPEPEQLKEVLRGIAQKTATAGLCVDQHVYLQLAFTDFSKQFLRAEDA